MADIIPIKKPPKVAKEPQYWLCSCPCGLFHVIDGQVVCSKCGKIQVGWEIGG